MPYGTVKVDQITTSNKTVTVDNLLDTNDLGSSVQAYDADTAKTDVAQSFTAAQRGTPVALSSSSGVVTPNFANANNFSLTLTEGTQIANPTNLTAGQSGVITITQSAGTPYSLTWGSYWNFAGGTALNATQTASAVDVMAYYVESGTRITVAAVANSSVS